MSRPPLQRCRPAASNSRLLQQTGARVDLGAAAGAATGRLETAELSMGGANLALQVNKPGRYRFELDARADAVARLRVTRVR